MKSNTRRSTVYEMYNLTSSRRKKRSTYAFQFKNVKKNFSSSHVSWGLPTLSLSRLNLRAHMSDLKAVGKETCASSCTTKYFLCTDMDNTCWFAFIITVKRCWNDFIPISHLQHTVLRIDSSRNHWRSVQNFLIENRTTFRIPVYKQEPWLAIKINK